MRPLPAIDWKRTGQAGLVGQEAWRKEKEEGKKNFWRMGEHIDEEERIKTAKEAEPEQFSSDDD